MNLVDLDFYSDVILLDGQEYDVSSGILNKYSKAVSIININEADEKRIELAKMVDYFICSKRFASKIPNINDNDLSEIYYQLNKIFNKNSIITSEENGCLVLV